MLRSHFDTILEEATTEEENNLMKMVERFHGELIPAQETRQAKLEDDVTEWVDITIPETIDRSAARRFEVLRCLHFLDMSRLRE